MYEYTSAVFGVSLDGFAPVDHDRINALADKGWEPVHMTSAHNGLAALVLFRREGGRTRAAAAAKPAAGTTARKAAAATTKAVARKAPVKKAPVKKAPVRKPAAAGRMPAAKVGAPAKKARRR